MEMIIIIVIIMVVMMLISGGDILPNMDKNVHARFELAKSQWACEEVVWKTASMVNDHFNGDMQVGCDVEGLSGGGIVALRQYMIDKIPTQAKTVHAGPIVETFDGMPSIRYDVTLKMNAEDESVLTRGTIHIATNGFTHLRNVFVAKQLPTKGKARFLKALHTEVNVEATDRPGWFHVRMVNGNMIERPWLVSESTFRKTLVSKTEDKFGEHTEGMLTDLANHL